MLPGAALALAPGYFILPVQGKDFLDGWFGIVTRKEPIEVLSIVLLLVLLSLNNLSGSAVTSVGRSRSTEKLWKRNLWAQFRTESNPPLESGSSERVTSFGLISRCWIGWYPGVTHLRARSVPDGVECGQTFKLDVRRSGL